MNVCHILVSFFVQTTSNVHLLVLAVPAPKIVDHSLNLSILLSLYCEYVITVPRMEFKFPVKTEKCVNRT